jgi:hypothetical protein
MSLFLDWAVCTFTRPSPPPPGTLIQLSIDGPTGEIRARAVVQDSKPNEGMGAKFVGMQKKRSSAIHSMARPTVSVIGKLIDELTKEFLCNLGNRRAADSSYWDSCFSHYRYIFFFLRHASPAAPPRLRQRQLKENR